MNIHTGWCYAAMCWTFGCQNHAPVDNMTISTDLPLKGQKGKDLVLVH